MVKIKVDTRGMNCPQPLVEAKKALRKIQSGEIVEVIGDHPESFTEIPKAMKESGHECEVEGEPNNWVIKIKKA